MLKVILKRHLDLSHLKSCMVATKSGKSGNFLFNQGKSREKGEIREVVKLLLLHCRVVTFSILYTIYTQAHIQLSATIAKFPRFYIILFCAVIMKCSYCCQVWGVARATEISHLQKLQNFAAE